MTRDGPQLFTKKKALGALDVVAGETGRKFVGFVHNNQIPVRCLELFQQVITAGKLIQPGYKEVVLIKRVSAVRQLNVLTRKNCEAHTEFFKKFVVPLFY